MKFFTATSTLAALVAYAAAASNAFISPLGGETWNAGDSVMISWVNASGSTVTLQVVHGESSNLQTAAIITSDFANSADSDGEVAVNWVVPDNLEPGSYALEIINNDNKDDVNFSGFVDIMGGTGDNSTDATSSAPVSSDAAASSSAPLSSDALSSAPISSDLSDALSSALPSDSMSDIAAANSSLPESTGVPNTSAALNSSSPFNSSIPVNSSMPSSTMFNSSTIESSAPASSSVFESSSIMSESSMVESSTEPESSSAAESSGSFGAQNIDSSTTPSTPTASPTMSRATTSASTAEASSANHAVMASAGIGLVGALVFALL